MYKYMFHTKPLTPEEIEQHNVAEDFRIYCAAILPLENQVLDNLIKKDLRAAWTCNKKKKSGTFLWITISPPVCTIELFLNNLRRFLKKKWVAEFAYTYVIEQRKTVAYYSHTDHDDNGKHIHIALANEKKKCKVISEIASTFKIPKSSVDSKKMILKYLPDKLEYMTGKKTGEGKEAKQMGDRVFRKIYNLDEVYTNAKVEVY